MTRPITASLTAPMVYSLMQSAASWFINGIAGNRDWRARKR